jgi:hypothetical protein
MTKGGGDLLFHLSSRSVMRQRMFSGPLSTVLRRNGIGFLRMVVGRTNSGFNCSPEAGGGRGNIGIYALRIYCCLAAVAAACHMMLARAIIS